MPVRQPVGASVYGRPVNNSPVRSPHDGSIRVAQCIAVLLSNQTPHSVSDWYPIQAADSAAHGHPHYGGS
jgi:hypothetical protein